MGGRARGPHLVDVKIAKVEAIPAVGRVEQGAAADVDVLAPVREDLPGAAQVDDEGVACVGELVEDAGLGNEVEQGPHPLRGVDLVVPAEHGPGLSRPTDHT